MQCTMGVSSREEKIFYLSPYNASDFETELGQDNINELPEVPGDALSKILHFYET